MKKSQFSIVGAIVAAVLACSCSTPKNVTYVQDVSQGTYQMPEIFDGAVKAQPDDKLQITVNSKDPALAALFNLRSESGGGNNQLYYTVDHMGNIDFPVVGEVHVAGLTRAGIASEIKNILISRDLIKDPTVNVEFRGSAISVLGEVSRPGRVNLDKDHVTLLEAIAQAGDLTINGERENVKIIRQIDGGKQEVYVVDLTSAASIYGSPAYYLQQDDVVYVEPNATRKRQRTANGSSILTPTFWISIASFLASMAVLIWK